MDKAKSFKAPLQQRSRETLSRIYVVTNELLLEKDFDQIKMAEISERADVTIGSIYQRFGSKNDLLWVMYERYLNEATEKFAELHADKTEREFPERVNNLIIFVCTLFSANKGVIRSLLFRYRQDPDSVPEQFLAQIEDAFESSAQYLIKEDETELDDPTIRFAISVIVANIREHTLFSRSQFGGAEAITTPEFAHLMTKAVMGIVGNTYGGKK
jgi:AcrR family transcriptional regulator